jgi:mediator of RNA polymerase II transcription subunit 16
MPCSKISWSKNGFIAYSDLSPSSNLSITKLQSIKGSSWRLSPKRTYQIKADPLANLNDLKHLQWSVSGSELAVIDEIGNLTILGTGISKSSSNTHQVSCFEDIEILYQDDVASDPTNGNTGLKDLKLANDTAFTDVLAFKWLNVDKPVIYNSPAIKNNDNTYNYTVHQYKPYGVLHHTQGKTGGFTIRRNGLLSFYYQNANPVMEFEKANVFLEGDGESSLIDDASIGYNRDGTVLVVTFSLIDHNVRFYKISLDWGNAPHDKLVPNMKINKLVTESVNRLGSNGLMLVFDSIEVISSNFSSDVETDILLTFTGPGVGNGKTLLQKFQISNEFNNLRFKNEVLSVEGFPNLKLVNEIVIPQRIISINIKNFDFLLVLTTENGEIQLRSRKTLNIHEKSHSSISTLLDVGFHFTKPDKAPETAVISPCLCGYVSLDRNELTFKTLERPKGKPWDEDEKFAASAAVSYLFASACYTNTGADELIATVQREISKIESSQVRESLTLKILEESHRALNFSLDFSKDQIDRLLVNPPIQKLLSFQYSLGKYAVTNEQSSIALCVLNLRLVSFSVMLSLRTLFHQQQRIAKKGNVESLIESIHRSENLLSTVGTANWFIEFLVFSLQGLIGLSVDYNHQTVVFSLLLSKIPRSLMIYSIAGLKKVEGFLTKVEENYKLNRQQTPLSLELFNTSVRRFRDLLNLVDLDTYEKFLNEVEAILATTQKGNLGLKIEQQLIFSNRVPDVYKPIIPQIIAKFQERFMSLNLSDLFFHDTSWLKFQIKQNEITRTTILSNDDRVPPSVNLLHDIIDDVTKTKIIRKEKLKKCVRCEYITSGLNSSEAFSILGGSINGLPLVSSSNWPVAFQRTCICGSCWIYVNDDEIVS